MEKIIQQNTEASLILWLLAVANDLKKNGDILTARAGLTTQQWLVLLHLHGDPNLPIWKGSDVPRPLGASELAASLGVSRAYMTNLLAGLIQKKFVLQTEDATDKRRKILRLTDEGRNALESLEPQRARANSLLFDVFEPSERLFFLEFLQHCQQKLDNLEIR